MRIYTRTGDDGTTGLLGAPRVPKHDARVEAYGSVDELNAALGVVRSLDPHGPLDAEMASIQSSLLWVGAELATTDAAMLHKLSRVADTHVTELEQLIDRLEQELPPLSNFILPGGSPPGAQLHFARTICRRAERRVTALAQSAGVEPRLVRYLNRLGDALFVMARWCNYRSGAGETTWP